MMFKALILGMWLSNACDTGSSVYAFKHGAVESNPFVVSTRTAPFVIQSAATVAGETFLAYQLHKRHPRIANLLLAGHISLGAYLTVHNVRIGNELKHGR